LTRPGAEAITVGLLAKPVVNSEVASLADDTYLTLAGFSWEVMWGIACSASVLSPA
jgi:hypothetical protein